MDEKMLETLEKKQGALELLIKLNVPKFSMDDLKTAESILELQELTMRGEYNIARQKYPIILKLVQADHDLRINGVNYVKQFYYKLYEK